MLFPKSDPNTANLLIQNGRKVSDLDKRITYYETLFNSFDFAHRFQYRDVGPEEFLLSPYFLNLKNEVYPVVRDEFIKLNSGDYIEAIFTGAIGTAKTTLALWTNAYQLFRVSRLKYPQQTFGLDSSSEILFVFQSISAQLSKAVDFDRFNTLIRRCDYFKENFPPNPNLTSELVFPNRVIVRPVSGEQTAAIGQNVFGGLLDEVNYMSVVEKSKNSVDRGTYDQAVELYNSIARRRKSRFMKQGKLPGIFCIVSSKRYPGQFTDIKTEEANKELRETGKTSIYIYDKRTWEVLPNDRFSGPTFRVFIGDETRKPRILEDDETVSADDCNLILDVPIEYRNEFEQDIINALREIGGVSTLARFPYFINNEAVAACFKKKISVLSQNSIDFVQRKVKVYPQRFENPTYPRAIHIDLAVSGDAAGMCCGYVNKFVPIDRGNDLVELLPNIRLDFALQITPPKNGEIIFERIRKLIFTLSDYGLNIRWVTLDSFQSTDTMQLLRQKGYLSTLLSMDKTTTPYDVTKTAIYDGRVQIEDHPILRKELLSLERNPKDNKIDHPPNGSKDVADALAGVCYGLTIRREIWAMHNIPPSMIPQALVEAVKKQDQKEAAKAAA